MGVTIWLVLRFCKGLINSLREVLLRQLDLVDKSTSIAAAHDLAVYQGIQVMGATGQVGYDDPYNPSDEAAARREAETLGLDWEDIRAEDNAGLTAAFE